MGLRCLPSRILAEVRSIASQLAGTKLSRWLGCPSWETDLSVNGAMNQSPSPFRARTKLKRATVRCSDRHQLFFYYLIEMNRIHRWYCRSGHWKQTLESEVLPWSLRGVDLGNDVLEVGPGPGLTTEWLRHQCRSLNCIEVDRESARSLGQRMANSNVRVQCADATAMPYRDGTFSGAVSFTMLHHVPSSALQDRLFAEVYRVLRPGGVFAGTDSMPSLLMRIFHIRDTMVLVDPATLPARLGAVGFKDAKIEIDAGRFRFFARRPSAMRS